MFRPSPFEIAMIVLALLLLFGARRIPEIARSIGQALKEFKKGLKDGMDDQNRTGGGEG